MNEYVIDTGTGFKGCCSDPTDILVSEGFGEYECVDVPVGCGDDSCDGEIIGTECTACSEAVCGNGVAEGCYWDGSSCLKDGTYWELNPFPHCESTYFCSTSCNPFTQSCVGETPGCDANQFCCNAWFGSWTQSCYSSGESIPQESGIVNAYRCY